MARADIDRFVEIPKETFFETVTRFEDYTEFVDGVSRVEVDRSNPDAVVVTYYVNLMKEISYTLKHRSDLESGVIEWELVSSDFVNQNTGRWELRSEGDGTQVHYELEIDFKFPVPGFVLKKLIKGSLPKMLDNFERRARQ